MARDNNNTNSTDVNQEKRNILLVQDQRREWGKEDEHLIYSYSKLHPYFTPSNKTNTKITKVKKNKKL